MEESVGPRPELVDRALELSEALRQHTTAARNLMGLLRDSTHLTALLVASVPSDDWTSVWAIRRLHRDELRNASRLADELENWGWEKISTSDHFSKTPSCA